VVIGIYKLVKTVALLAAGFFLGYLIKPDNHQEWVDFLDQTRDDPHNHFLRLIMEHVLALSLGKLEMFRIGVFLYAGLFSIEGVGLLFDRKWAEWLVIITTAGFIPFEIYEVAEHVTWIRYWGVLITNIVVLIYLCFRLRRMAVVKRERQILTPASAAPQPSPPPKVQPS